MDYKKSKAPTNTVTHNREQIEISRYYERLPKATLIAADEFLRGKVYFKNPNKDRNQHLTKD